MANILKFDGASCTDNKRFTFEVDDPLSEIILNGTYYFESLGQIPSGCYTVTGNIIPSSGPVNMILGDTYTGCLDCLTGTSLYVLVGYCPPNRNVDLYPLPISAFTGTVDIDQTYYISLIYRGKEFTSCFYINKFLPEYDGAIAEVTSVPLLEDDCDTCFNENSFVYEVTDCLEGNSTYIQLSSGDYVGNLITYYDPSLLQQFCGVVGDIIDTIPNVTLVADLGLFLDDKQCEECLDQVADKRIITNCLNGTESVVWASTLFGSEDFSNLSYELGCYDIGDLTESGVTITSFLNFDPQPSCTDCIECTGIQYDYSSCTNTGPISSFTPVYLGTSITLTPGFNGPFTGTTDSINGFGATFYVEVDGGGVYLDTSISENGVRYNIGDTIVIDGSLFGGVTGDDDVTITVTNVTLSGSVISYQYVENPISTTLYVPWLNDCVEITSYSNPIVSTTYPIYSFNSLSDCETCGLSDNFVWLGESCSDGSQAIITTTNGFTLGDIVKVNRGSVEFDCYTLVSPYDPSMGIYDTYNSLTNNAYQTCGECTLNSRINISIAECDGSNQQYVSISLDDWFTFTNFGYTTFNTNQYNTSKCYNVINTCPINGDYPKINILSFYFNCDECVFDNTRQPRSANTETVICYTCLSDVNNGNAFYYTNSVPHPVYTDGYGTPVTQLDMVTLGGVNGLNN